MEMLLKKRLKEIIYQTVHIKAVARLLQSRKEFETFPSALRGSNKHKRKDTQIPITSNLHQPYTEAHNLATILYVHTVSNHLFMLLTQRN